MSASTRAGPRTAPSSGQKAAGAVEGAGRLSECEDVSRANHGSGGLAARPARQVGSCHRLSRHAMRYNGDLRTSSMVVLERPMSASSRSSSARSSWYCRRRSKAHAISASHASGFFHRLTSGRDSAIGVMVQVELEVVLPQDMFHLRIGAKQHLAAGAHRAVVIVPSSLCTMPSSGAQAIPRPTAKQRSATRSRRRSPAAPCRSAS
jgi:hypothetical protein